MKWNTHLVVDGHAKVDESKHRHIHKDTLGKWNEREYVVVKISIYVMTGALLLMKLSKNLNKERGLKSLAEPEDDAEGVCQQ